MDKDQILKSYKEADYTGDPKLLTGTEMVYKYRDPIHFIEVINEVHTKGLRKANQSSSIKQDNGWDKGWHGSPNLESAIEKFRTAEFDKNDSKKMNQLIVQMRQGVKYVDVGDDISIPEFLGGSREHWIEFEDRDRKKQPVMKTPIFINLSAAARENESDMSRAALQIIKKLYEAQVKAPKIVICYFSDMGDTGKLNIFIEMPYFDFNSLKRFSFASTFRRIAFVNYELVKDLPWAYGYPFQLPFPETLRDIISVDKFTLMSNKEIDTNMDTIISNTFKKK